MTLVFLAALTILAAKAAKSTYSECVRSPLFPIVCLLAFTALLTPHQITTRYSFFLYPCILVCVALALRKLATKFISTPKARSAAIASGCLGLFALSPDFNAAHLAKINSDDINFRTGPYARHEKHWYPRHNFKAAAEYLNANAKANDLVIISGLELPPRYTHETQLHA
jgi:hypothetical protein